MVRLDILSTNLDFNYVVLHTKTARSTVKYIFLLHFFLLFMSLVAIYTILFYYPALYKYTMTSSIYVIPSFMLLS